MLTNNTKNIAMLVLTCTVAAWPQTVQQKSTGDCSPTIANVNGTITFNCPGIPKKAEKVLNGLLDKMYKDLQEKTKAAEEWTNRYQDLRTRLAAQGDESVLAKEATKLLQDGDLERAGALLDKLIMQQEGEIGHLAENLFNRSQIYLLQFRSKEALESAKRAYSYKPENPQFAHQYALLLLHEEHRDEAEQVLLKQIKILTHRSRNNEDSSYLAKDLDNLGCIEAQSLRFDDAHSRFIMAASIARELLSVDPVKFLSLVAGTLSNKAGSEIEVFKYKEAEEDLAESISLVDSSIGPFNLEELKNSDEKQKLVSTLIASLDNMSGLQVQLKNFQKAKDFNSRALDLVRKLLLVTGHKYERDLLHTLQNTAQIYIALGELDMAKKMNDEGLQFAQSLAHNDPEPYKSYLARSLRISCHLLRLQSRFSEAKATCEQASELYRDLRTRDPRLYASEHAFVFLFLAEVSLGLNNPVEAKANYERALEIERSIAQQVPFVAQPQLARVLHDSSVYDLAALQFESAMPRLKEAIILLRGLAEHDPQFVVLLGESLNALGVFQLTAGLLDEAGNSFADALHIEESLAQRDFYQNGPMLGQIHLNLAAYHRLKCNFEESEAQYKQSIEVNTRLAAHDRNLEVQILVPLFNLIGQYKLLGRWTEALESAQTALAISKKLLPPNPVIVAEQLENLASIEWNKGDNQVADLHIQQGLRFYHKAAEEEQFNAAIVPSILAMSSAFEENSSKCKLLDLARSLASDSATRATIDSLIAGCRNSLPWPLYSRRGFPPIQ